MYGNSKAAILMVGVKLFHSRGKVNQSLEEILFISVTFTLLTLKRNFNK